MLSFLMMSQCKKHADILKVLLKANRKQRKAILQVADRDWIDAICECALNLLAGNVPLSTSQKKKITPYKNHLRLLSEPTTSLKRKRKLLSQRGGNWLNLLIGPVLKVLNEIF